MATFNRQRLVFGLYLLVLIAVAELVAGHFGLPAWPAFMAMIFFFVEHMDPKKAPHILVGAVFGIACILLAAPVIGTLAPIFFNNYAFMYLTVTGLAVQLPHPRPFLWMAIAGIGGGLLIAGVIGILKLMARGAEAKA